MALPSQQIDRNLGKSKLPDFFRKDLPRYFLLIATVLVAIFFWILQPKFMTLENFSNIFSASAAIGTMAIAVVIALASGEMNFAVGAQATLAAIVVGVLLDINGIPYSAAFLAGVGAAMLSGLLGIGLTLKIGVPSFIATVGVSTLVIGFVKLLTGNKIYYSANWPKSFAYIGQGFIGSIPVIIIAFAIIIAVTWILVDFTRLGRHIFAVGTNMTACRQVGINNKKIKLIAFMLSSAIAGISGIFVASRSLRVEPTLGSNIMMGAFAAAFLGGTFLRPGRFNIQGTVVSVILMTIIQNGIYSTGSGYATGFFFQGVIFLLAVGIIALTRKEGLPGVKFG
jgi:ribose/xylose/arabinose/galactoside ABC-type transport system permease subunit